MLKKIEVPDIELEPTVILLIEEYAEMHNLTFNEAINKVIRKFMVDVFKSDNKPYPFIIHREQEPTKRTPWTDSQPFYTDGTNKTITTHEGTDYDTTINCARY